MRLSVLFVFACGAGQASTMELPEQQTTPPLPSVSASPTVAAKPHMAPQPTTHAQPTASATEPPDQLALARQTFMEGMQAYDAGDYATALRKFEETNKIASRPQVLFNIGRALEALGRKREAADRYDEYVHTNPSPPNANEVSARARALRGQP